MTEKQKKFTKEEVLEASTKYFNGDTLAANVFTDKYAARINDNTYLELTPDETHRRMAKEYARIEKKYGGEHQLSEDEIYELFKNFKYIVPGGSVMSGLGTNNGTIESLSNCFVLGRPGDSYASIMRYRDFMVEVEKRRGGAGLDLSNLRPEGTKVKNAAKTSTGPVSFMEGFSKLSEEVAQGGRRGALMISMHCNHPDIEQFIEVKQDLSKVTGANISVQFTDSFMTAVKNNGTYMLRWPVELTDKQVDYYINDYYEIDEETGLKIIPGVIFGKKNWLDNNTVCIKPVHARDIWNRFVECAWKTAEPGLMYVDRHHNMSPDGVYEEYRGVTTNP